MPAPVAVQSEELVSKKSKKDKSSKKKKRETEPEPVSVEAAVVAGELNGGQKKKDKSKKKSKKVEEKVAEVSSVEVSEELSKKLKKKKKERKEQESGDHDVEMAVENSEKSKKKKSKKSKKESSSPDGRDKAGVSVANGSSELQKKFYREHPAVSAMSDAEAKELRAKLNITLAGTNCNVKPIQAFAHTGLPANMLAVCSGFEKPTPIQSQCWPIILSGRDIIAIAETGSGKTLGFGLPALMHISAQKPLGSKPTDRGPIMLVMSPTRELALQTQEVLEAAGKNCGIKSACIYGGMPKDQQRRLLSQGQHIVVATPGRLLALLQEGICSLKRCTYLVLDEADRMLDQGFEPDIRAIIGQIPCPDRQTLMFSATWPLAIQALGKEFLKDPVHVTIGTPNELAANHRVKQTVEVIEDKARLNRLFELLNQFHASRTNRVLIFVLYKKEVGWLEGMLRRKGWVAKGISGDKSQSDRFQALQEFKDGTTPLLIATDVAARGLDIPNVEHVINFSFPLTVEDYVHRIGRTGRGGKMGNSYTFFQKFDKGLAGELVNILREANEVVPDELLKFGTGVKRKKHDMYGDHFKKDDERPMAKKVHMKF